MRLVKSILFAASLATTASLSVLSTPAFGKQSKDSIVVRAEPSEFVTRSVGYRDINLLLPAGVKALNGRVQSAVTDVCLEATFEAKAFLSCEDTAWIGARPQIERAVAQAREMAMTGSSAVAASAIVIDISG